MDGLQLDYPVLYRQWNTLTVTEKTGGEYLNKTSSHVKVQGEPNLIELWVPRLGGVYVWNLD